MDFNRAEELVNQLADIVDLPLHEESPRFRLSHTLAITSLHFAASIRILCSENLALGSASLLRSQFEAVVRSVWALQKATDLQIEKLSSQLTLESQQAAKGVPMLNGMLTELEKLPHLENFLVPLRELKASSWVPLNSFVHSGIYAVHWTKHEAPPQLLDQIFRVSNGLAMQAFMSIAILTGQPGLQREIIAVTAPFSSCLPSHRKDHA